MILICMFAEKTIMKHLIVLLLSLIYLNGFSQTQMEMNQKANESFKKADKELNKIYKTILTEYKSDTAFIQNLKISQRIWITFRDAELKTKFPDGDYGSVHPMCESNYLEELTLERIKKLKQWIDGTEEGDSCSGSVKIINK